MSYCVTGKVTVEVPAPVAGRSAVATCQPLGTVTVGSTMMFRT